MRRPTIIVTEAEPAEALSVRKLVLETAKFNVLTAHSTEEAINVFQDFPESEVAVVAGGDSIDCDRIADAVRSVRPKVPIVYLSPHVAPMASCADHTLSSHDPEALVALLRSMLGDPRKIPTAVR